MLYNTFIMARTGKLTTDEILKAEKAKEDRKAHRAAGFEKMKERDAGYALILDRGSDTSIVQMLWGGSLSEEADNAGLFALEISPNKHNSNKIKLLINAEELRKHLRWV